MRRLLAVLVLTVVVLAGPVSGAGDVSILSAGAVEPGLVTVVAAFEKRTGTSVNVTFDNVPQIRARVLGGQRWDIIIATPAVLDELVASSKADTERVVIGRVGMGAAVRAGARVPDLSNGEALRRSVLAADSLVFSRGSSGVYFESLLRKMGVYQQVEGKITRYTNGTAVFEHILRGSGNEVSFGQITEIGLHRGKGLQFVGPLPPEFQNYTTYAAATMREPANADAAIHFVRELGAPTVRAVFAAAGIE